MTRVMFICGDWHRIDIHPQEVTDGELSEATQECPGLEKNGNFVLLFPQFLSLVLT